MSGILWSGKQDGVDDSNISIVLQFSFYRFQLPKINACCLLCDIYRHYSYQRDQINGLGGARFAAHTCNRNNGVALVGRNDNEQKF